jgi:hypothetical protein
MRSIFALLALSVPVQSLYFFIDGTAPKCFFEELPKDTLVVGHYSAEEYDEQRKTWTKHDGLNIYISVDVRFFPGLHNFHSGSDAVHRRYSTTITA